MGVLRDIIHSHLLSLASGISRTATLVVAASDSTAKSKAQADYVCDGVDDDVQIQAAIDAAPNIYLTEGTFSCTSTIAFPSHRRFRGAGSNATQIVQATADIPLFTLASANGYHLSDFNAAIVAGDGAVFELTNVHRSTFEDIQAWRSGSGDGKYMFRLKGCILNTFKRVFFPGGYVYGFYGEVHNVTSCNANTFIGCVVEGGQVGYYFADQSAQGDTTITGGAIEGQSVRALYAYNCLAFAIFGCHIEGATSGLYFENCGDVGIYSIRTDRLDLVNCSDVLVTGGYIVYVTVDVDCQNVKLENFRYASVPLVLSETTEMVNLQPQSSGNLLGIGLRNPRTLLTRNGNLENWTGGVPDGFVNFATATLTQTGTGEADTTKHFGTYACKVAKAASASSYKGLGFIVPTAFKGSWINIESRIKGIVGNAIIVAYFDGGASVGGEGDPVSTSWHKSQVRLWWDPQYSAMTIVFCPPYADAAGSFYIDKISIWSDYESNVETYGSEVINAGATGVKVFHGCLGTPTSFIPQWTTLAPANCNTWAVTAMTPTNCVINFAGDPGVNIGFLWEAKLR